MSVRFAFLGCGLIARHHLRALQESRHSAEVVAVVDSNRRYAEEFVKLLPRPEDCKVFILVQYAVYRLAPPSIVVRQNYFLLGV